MEDEVKRIKEEFEEKQRKKKEKEKEKEKEKDKDKDKKDDGKAKEEEKKSEDKVSKHSMIETGDTAYARQKDNSTPDTPEDEPRIFALKK